MKLKGNNNGLSRHAPFKGYVRSLSVSSDEPKQVVMLSQLLIAGAPVAVILGFEGRTYPIDRIDPIGKQDTEHVWHLHTATAIRGHLPGWFMLTGDQKTAEVAFGGFDDLSILGVELDRLERTPDEQAVVRYNIAAVGYLTLRVVLGPESMNRRVSILSSIDEIRSACNLYSSHPDHYRWAVLLIEEDGTAVSEVAEATTRGTSQAVELRFTSRIASRNYCVQLAVAAGTITNPIVEYAGTPQTPTYEAAGIHYNTDTGYYELNGLTDLTEAQTAHILRAGPLMEGVKFQYGGGVTKALPTDVRTNLCYPSWYNGTTLTEKFRGNASLEVALIISSRERHDAEANSQYYTILKDTRLSYCFDSCTRLRRVIGVLDCTYVTSGSDGWACPILEEIFLWGIVASFNMKGSSHLSMQSVRYMIRNAAPTGPITFIYHPDVYAMAMADTDVQAALSAQPLVALATA